MSAEIDIPRILGAHGRGSYSVFSDDGPAMTEGRLDDERARFSMLKSHHTLFCLPEHARYCKFVRAPF